LGCTRPVIISGSAETARPSLVVPDSRRLDVLPVGRVNSDITLLSLEVLATSSLAWLEGGGFIQGLDLLGS
jgi:hypothetical protein